MKKILILAFTTLFTLGLFAQNITNDNRLIVNGTAELQAEADQASFMYEVEGFGSTLKEAVDNAKKKARETTQKLFDLGLKEENLATSSFFSGENTGGKAFLSSSKDFHATIKVTVMLFDLKKLEDAILTLSECDIVNMSRIDFSLRNPAVYKEKARKEAVALAKKKGKELAEEMGIKLGKVVRVEENHAGIYPMNGMVMAKGGFNAAPPTFHAATMKVSASLRISYTIE